MRHANFQGTYNRNIFQLKDVSVILWMTLCSYVAWLGQLLTNLIANGDYTFWSKLLVKKY